VHEGVTLFDGYIERLSFSSDSLCITMLCFDRSSLLAKNEVYRAFYGTPAAIAAKVCGLVGLECGSLWHKSGSLYLPPSCGCTAFSVIRRAYGQQCVVETQNGRVVIFAPGQDSFTLRSAVLLQAEARHSTEDMVNRAVILGYKNRVEASAEHSGDIVSYGLRQRCYTLSGARAGASSQAADHLQRLQQQASVTLLGNTAARCGARVTMDSPAYGVSGEYLITAVTHRVSGGLFTTTLGMVK